MNYGADIAEKGKERIEVLDAGKSSCDTRGSVAHCSPRGPHVSAHASAGCYTIPQHRGPDQPARTGNEDRFRVAVTHTFSRAYFANARARFAIVVTLSSVSADAIGNQSRSLPPGGRLCRL